MTVGLFDRGMFRGEEAWFIVGTTLADEYLFGATNGFLGLARKFFSDVRRVDLGSHLTPLAMQREHEGSCVPG
jgi:hypothetical protein